MGGDVPLAASNAVPMEPNGAARPISRVLGGCTAPSFHPHPWVVRVPAAGRGWGVIGWGEATLQPPPPTEQRHIPPGGAHSSCVSSSEHRSAPRSALVSGSSGSQPPSSNGRCRTLALYL